MKEKELSGEEEIFLSDNEDIYIFPSSFLHNLIDT